MRKWKYSFMIRVYSNNIKNWNNKWSTQETTQKTTQKTTQEKILVEIKENPKITRKQLKEKIWSITEDWIKYHLKKLQETWKLKRIWPKKWWYWKVA